MNKINHSVDVGAVLIQLKPDALGNVDAWKMTLNARKEAAVETLKAGGLFVASWFYVVIEGLDYSQKHC